MGRLHNRCECPERRGSRVQGGEIVSKATSDSRRLQSYGKNCTFASNTTGRLLPIVFVSDVAQNSAVLCLDLAGEALRLQAVDMALQTMVRRLLLLECRAL
jgi:hypothetical protein